MCRSATQPDPETRMILAERAGRALFVVCLVTLLAGVASAESGSQARSSKWKLAENRVDAGSAVAVFVESNKTKGRPAFKIETTFDATPLVAAQTLMADMLDESNQIKGQRKKVLSRGDHDALVYTFIDLPLMLADRELALRIVHSEEATTGVHRIDWKEANEALSSGSGDVLRLEGTNGFWEFRPEGPGRTGATYMSQTEIGGSIPAAIGDRLMKSQAVEAVERLRAQIAARLRTHVASGAPPAPAPPGVKGRD